MRKPIAVLVGLIVVIAVLLPVTPQAVRAAPEEQAAVARVRFVNAGVDMSALNVTANGTLWAGGVAEAVGYLDIPAGAYTFAFQLPGLGEALASVDFTLDPGARVTVAALGTQADLHAIAVEDDVSAPARHAARVKLVNALPDADPVRVLLNGDVLADSLVYGAVSDAAQVAAGSHAVTVEDAAGAAIYSTSGLLLDANRVYTLFLTRRGDQPRLLVADSSVLRADPTSQIRFAHMAHETGPVAVYVNREAVPLFDRVGFSSVTTYMVTGQGPHLVEVYPAGAAPATTEPIASMTARVGAQESVIVVLQGGSDDVALKAYATDLGALPPESTRLYVIYAAHGNPAARVTTLDGLPLFDRIAVGGVAQRVVPAGGYNVRLTDADDDSGEPALLMEQTGLYFPPGSAAALIVFDDNPRLPLVNAVLVAADNVPQYAAVRWLHADATGPAVDIYLDNELLLSDWDYGSATGYTLLAPRLYTLRVFRAGANPDVVLPLIDRTMDLRATGGPRTAVLFGSPEQVQVVTIPESTDLLPADRARVRFVNVAAGLDAVAAQNDGTGALIVDTIPYGAGSINVNIPAGDYTIGFVRGGESLLTLSDRTFEAGTAYTIVLDGHPAAGAPLDAHMLESRP